MLRPRATSAGCAINQPVRERRTQTQPETNQLDVTRIFCGKLSHCPVRGATGRAAIEKSAEIRSCQRYLRSSCTAAWPHATQLPSKAGAENERPVRGDNRTGQAIWALGVDGRSRLIQPMGRDYRSHIDKSQHPRRTFKTPGDFFNLVSGR